MQWAVIAAATSRKANQEEGQEAGSKAIGKRAVGGGLHEVGCRFGPQDKDFNLKTSNEARLFLNQKPRTGCLS